MSQPDIWDSVRTLIRDQELLNAVELMESWLKGRLNGPKETKIRGWLNELIVHHAAINGLRTRARRGLVSPDDERVELSKTSLNLLDLIDVLQQEDRTSASIAPDIASIPLAYVEGNFEKIIGDKSHLQMISWLERGLQCSTGVCRIVGANFTGTGFRVSGNVIVTNNHVLARLETVGDTSSQFFFEERLDRSIKEVVSVALDSRRFWTSPELDITLVGGHFEANPRQSEIHELELGLHANVAVGDAVSIIQHPLGGPKQIALTSNQVINIFEHRIQYVTDTLPGSSGSPVFNQQWEVIAIHHAGGNLLKNKSGDRVFANEGIEVRALNAVADAVKMLEAR